MAWDAALVEMFPVELLERVAALTERGRAVQTTVREMAELAQELEARMAPQHGMSHEVWQCIRERSGAGAFLDVLWDLHAALWEGLA